VNEFLKNKTNFNSGLRFLMEQHEKVLLNSEVIEHIFRVYAKSFISEVEELTEVPPMEEGQDPEAYEAIRATYLREIVAQEEHNRRVTRLQKVLNVVVDQPEMVEDEEGNMHEVPK